MNIRHSIATLVLGLCAAGAAMAQQVTRIVVPFPAGGGTDQYVRLLAADLTKRGMQVIVENKPGASGIVAADHVARSRADGSTVLMSSLGILANNTVIYDKLPTTRSRTSRPSRRSPTSRPSWWAAWTCPTRTSRKWWPMPRPTPARSTAAHPGASILTNLAPMAFEKQAGISTTHIPFSGDAPGLQALLGSQIDIHGTSITGPLQHVKAGKMRVLGVMDSQRLAQVPDAPTFKEQGYDIEALLWYSLSVPAATPKDVIDRLNRAVNQVIADPDFVARARAIGMEPRGGTSEDLAKFIRVEFDRWVPLLQSLNLPKQAH
jgi:tripartite-type tricarboxylate transporter receptor subunit TctC